MTVLIGVIGILHFQRQKSNSSFINTNGSAGSIPGLVRYRSIPEFCSILDTYVVSLIFT